MSAYIVNDKTITVIAKGFEKYNVTFKADDYRPQISLFYDRNTFLTEIGQSLLNCNTAAVNYRYGENAEPRKFKLADVDFNEGVLVGCIDCFIYQASELDDFFNTEIYFSLDRLRYAVLKRLIEEKGQEIGFGL